MKMRKRKHRQAKLSRSYRANAMWRAKFGACLEEMSAALADNAVEFKRAWNEVISGLVRSLFRSLVADLVADIARASCTRGVLESLRKTRK